MSLYGSGQKIDTRKLISINKIKEVFHEMHGMF